MATYATGKNATATLEVERAELSGIGEIALNEKVYDGDDALKILHTHFEPYDKKEERAVVRKIDRRLIPIMLIVNGLQFLDKNVRLYLMRTLYYLSLTHSKTISSAATYGLAGQAHLVGQEFSLLISIFYIGYLLAQYPTNILIQKYPTGKYITINFVLWGMTTFLFALLFCISHLKRAFEYRDDSASVISLPSDFM